MPPDQLVSSLEDLGVLVYFLPPYSSDLNPIEELFSKVKSVMKANKYILEDYDLETSILLGRHDIQRRRGRERESEHKQKIAN